MSSPIRVRHNSLGAQCRVWDRMIRREPRYLVIIWGKCKLHATFIFDNIRTCLSCIREFDVVATIIRECEIAINRESRYHLEHPQ